MIHKIKEYLIMALLGILCPSAIYAQDKVRGYVYNDIDQNGKKESTEKGIPNVSVSNGRDVVLTDKMGKYELPISDDEIIFVIKPQGYTLRTDKHNLPRFYYIHKPNGSPKFEDSGVEPTGKVPSKLNFPLTAYEEPEKFRALIFGDPQVKDQMELSFFEKGIVSEVENVENVAFGMTLGDLVQKDKDLYRPYTSVVSKIGVPWFNVIGNHDLNMDAKTLKDRDESYSAQFGPATYAFNYGKAHIIVLDDNLYPDPRDGKGLWGGFMEEQFEFLENDLKYVSPDKLIILAFHIPLYQIEGSFRTEDRERLFKLIEKFPYVFAMSAHTHNQKQNFYGKEFGWTQKEPFYELNVGATCGNWWSGRVMGNGVVQSVMSDGTPKGYIYLNIDGNQYTADFKVADKPSEYQIGVYHRKVLSTIWWDSRGYVYANFFMGYEKSKVECSIDGGEWKPMTFYPNPDPAFVSELFKWDETAEMFKGRRPTEAANSTHLWRISQPNDLGLGKHTIKIRAFDVFGRVFHQDSEFSIEEAKFE